MHNNRENNERRHGSNCHACQDWRNTEAAHNGEIHMARDPENEHERSLLCRMAVLVTSPMMFLDIQGQGSPNLPKS